MAQLASLINRSPRGVRRAAALGACIAAASLLAAPAAGAERSGAERGEFRGAKTTAFPAWFKQSFLELDADVAEAAAQGRRVMVFLHQDGCPYCNALVEKNLAIDAIEEKVRSNFDVIDINIWGDREVVAPGGAVHTEKTFAAAIGVQFTPTLLFLDEHARVALRLNGYLPPGEFDVALDYAAGRHERTVSYREYVAARRASTSGSELRAEPFFMSPPFVLARGPGARPLAVVFEHPGCSPCAELHDGPLADPRTRALIERFDVVQLDMRADTPLVTPDGERTTARGWAEALGISFAPTIVYFDAGGTEVVRSEASFKTFHSQSMMDYVLSGAYRTEPSFQRYISERADAIRDSGRDVDIWR